MNDWLWRSAADLGRGIGAGEIDPVALTETFLAAIADHPHKDRIYARVTPERARTEAAAAAVRARTSRRLSPLDGVPVSWKDLFDTAGVATESGTRMLAGRVPEADAEVLRTATALGLVCLGKTHMSELAFSGLGLNPMTATPPNRHDPEALPGGSSSGAAASVAWGLAAAAIGTDTGGSVRTPAAWNDLVGLKTTHGLIGSEGVVPLCETLDTIGPLARTVEDTAHLFAALTGGAAPDLRRASLAGTRFLVLDTVMADEVEEGPATAFEAATDRLSAAGARIDRGGKWEPLHEAMDLTATLYSGEAYAIWGELMAERGGEMFHHIRERVEGGAAVAASAYVGGWRRLRQLRAEFAAHVAGYDAVLCPTVPILPPRAEAVLADDDLYRRANLMSLRNTRMANLLGLCSLTLPTGVPSCGIMFSAAPMSEARLLRIGAAAEAALS